MGLHEMTGHCRLCHIDDRIVEDHMQKIRICFQIRTFCVVEHRRFELLTPTLPVLCATNCANAPSTLRILARLLIFVKRKMKNLSKTQR